jgi:signal transduction histidine kinase
MLFVCLAIALALGGSASAWREHPKAPPALQAGQIDLTHWRFARDGSVSLSGSWVYFDHHWGAHGDAVYAPVPGNWPAFDARTGGVRPNGFGTYTLRLKLPEAPPGDMFVLDTGQVLSAYRVFANGKLIASPGMPAETKAEERANSYSVLTRLPEGARDVELRFEISNHLMPTGGVFVAPTVGLRSVLKPQRHLTEMLSLIVVGALIFTACYHIAFMHVTRGGYANVWFGALATLFGVRMFLFEPLASVTVPLIGQDWVWRLDFATTVLLVPTACWFLALSFPRHISRTFAALLMSACGALALASLIEGPAIGQRCLEIFELLGVLTLPYLVQGIVRSALAREQGAGLALLGITISSFAAIHDILLDQLVIAGPNFLPAGCVAFFLCFSGALTQRSHHAFIRTELLVDERTRELEEKIAELEQARAQAETANVSKSQFLANMSHELRTPLNAILGFSEIIREGLFGPHAMERYADYAGSIHTSGSHLLRLINDVLDLSKIEAGKLDLVDTCLDLSEEARAAMHLLEPQAQAKSVSLVLEHKLPGRTLGDTRAMRQILVNLLSNAVKFTPEGGRVTVSTSLNADQTIAVRVADNGVGIRPQDMSRVFDNYGQGRHDIRTRDANGTGLGLPIVKGLVEAMGGKIGIESAINVGTTVTIQLPAWRNVKEWETASAA